MASRKRETASSCTSSLDPEDPEPTDPGCAPAQNSDMPAKETPKPSLEQFLTENLAKLSPDEPVTQDFIDQLTELYKQQHGESTTGKETQLQEAAPKVYAFGLSKDQVVESWKSFMSSMDPLINKRLGEVQKFFKSYKSALMNQLGANIKSYGLHKARDKDDADEILDPSHYDNLVKEYIAQVDAALLEAYQHGYLDTLVNFKFDVRNEVALERLKAYAASKVQGIVDTTRDQMKDVLSEAFDEGVSVTEVGQRIAEKFAGIESGRAETIARTETLTAVSLGRQDKRDDFKEEFPDKKLQKMWVSAQDDKVRDSHQELDGQVVDEDEEFKANLKFPRDPDCDDPSEVINCRCTDISFVEGDEASIQATLPSEDQPDEEKSAPSPKAKVHRGENESFDDCVKRGIPLLINEGHSQDQAVAMANSMCEMPKKDGKNE